MKVDRLADAFQIVRGRFAGIYGKRDTYDVTGE